jgi:hypothetical protein
LFPVGRYCLYKFPLKYQQDADFLHGSRDSKEKPPITNERLFGVSYSTTWGFSAICGALWTMV